MRKGSGWSFRQGTCSRCRVCKVKAKNKPPTECTEPAHIKFYKHSLEVRYRRDKLVGRTRWLRQRYGITQHDYVQMLANQRGECAICAQTKPSGKYNVFAVDHNHETGKVRGLLCNQCNLGVENLERLLRLNVLQRAIRYVEES